MSGEGEDGAPGAGDRDLPPWMQPVTEEAAEFVEEGRLLRWRGRLMAGVALGALALFSVALWFLYQAQVHPQEPISVAAPEGPVRIAPDDRGGMQVAHRDMAVYGQVSGAGGTQEQVRLRPGPEAPAQIPEAPRIAMPDLEPKPVVGAYGSAVPASYVMTQRDRDGQSSGGSGRDADESAAAVGDDGNETWSVQIAAYRQERHARAFMVKAGSDHRDILGKLDGWVVKARKDMANYFRVRFGPLPDREAALATCRALQKAGLNCLIIAPGS